MGPSECWTWQWMNQRVDGNENNLIIGVWDYKKEVGSDETT
jgi:hypothetical protein